MKCHVIQVWALIGVVTVALGPVLWVMVWSQRGLEGRDHKAPRPHHSLQQLTFNMFRSLVVQGNLISSHDWSLRLVFIAWYFFCYNVYGEKTLKHSLRESSFITG